MLGPASVSPVAPWRSGYEGLIGSTVTAALREFLQAVLAPSASAFSSARTDPARLFSGPGSGRVNHVPSQGLRAGDVWVRRVARADRNRIGQQICAGVNPEWAVSVNNM